MAIRKWLILSHRYLGIVLGLLFVVWFASGIGMIYARGMPSLTEGMRLNRLEPLDLISVRLTPWEAAERAGLGDAIESVTLLMVMDRPAYRLVGGGGATVFSDTGELLDEVDPRGARQIASRFVDVAPERVHYERRLTRADQWTITQRQQLPVHKLSIDDNHHTQIYVSSESGEVTLLTTRASRALAWVAAIPHWLYFTPLRLRETLWRQTILWTAGLGCVLAILGITLGLLQFRFSRPFRLSRIRSHIPYTGWMQWHYITGAVFGIFALTWVFSGLLSMEPLGWASRGGLRTGELRQALIGGRLEPSAFPAIDPGAWDALLPGRSLKEITYRRILGKPYFMVQSTAAWSVETTAADPAHGGSIAGPTDIGRALITAETLAVRKESFSLDSLMSRVRETYPETEIVEVRLLEEYDSYHYSRELDAPLPILRVKFDDPDRTWMYIDPASGELATTIHRLDRVERWIYNGFHSLDFGFWYYNRPIWDIGVVVLSLGGMVMSAIGLFLGIRRLTRVERQVQR